MGGGTFVPHAQTLSTSLMSKLVNANKFKIFLIKTIYNNKQITFQRHQTETVTALTEKTLDDVSSHSVFSSTDENDQISITTEKGT